MLSLSPFSTKSIFHSIVFLNFECRRLSTLSLWISAWINLMFSILPLPFSRNFQMKVCIQKCRREKCINIYSPLHTNLTHAYKGDHFLLTRSPSSMQRKCYFLVVLSVQIPQLICLGGWWWRVTWQNVSLLLLIFKVAAWLTLVPSQRVSCKLFPSGKLWKSLCVCVCGGGVGCGKVLQGVHLYIHSVFDFLNMRNMFGLEPISVWHRRAYQFWMTSR